MSKAFLVGGLAALTLAVAGGVAVAQSAQDRPGRAMRADADGDSRISRSEFVSARVAPLTAADTDRSGSVTPEEMQAVAQARRAQRADARFERLDADDDGTISRTEFSAAGEARADRGGRRAGGHRGPGRAMAQRGPGAQPRGPVVIADAQARAEQGFARLDADSDGYLTAEEGRAGRRAMHEQRRERMAERRAARMTSPGAPASE